MASPTALAAMLLPSESTSLCLMTKASENSTCLTSLTARRTVTLRKAASSPSKLCGPFRTRISFWSLRLSLSKTDGMALILELYHGRRVRGGVGYNSVSPAHRADVAKLADALD